MPQDDDAQAAEAEVELAMKHYGAMKVFLGLAVIAVLFGVFVNMAWGIIAGILFVWLATKAAETGPECGRGKDWGVPVRSVD